jgi:hypothetical protein
MKYLKLFEDNIESYYIEMNDHDFDDKISYNNGDNMVDFTELEYEKIKNVIDSLFSKYNIKRKYYELENDAYRGIESNNIYINFDGYDLKRRFFLCNIYIYCLRDEWYYIQLDLDVDGGNDDNEFNDGVSLYYQCDQWPGLMGCLKEISNLV